MRTDLIPPQAVELEEMVIGAILLEPEVITEIVTFLTPECFYNTTLARVYGVIMQMFDHDERIDSQTVFHQCKSIPELKTTKIAALLAQCTARIGTGAHIVDHARIIKEKHIAREIIAVGEQLTVKASDSGEDVDDVLDYLSKQADALNGLATGGGARHIKESLTDALQAAENRQKLANSGKVSGITTGITALDKMTGGWQASQLIILAARPAMGKTALMLHFAKAAARSGVPVCIYSLEMSRVSLTNRLLLSECDVDVNNFRSGRLTPNDWRQLAEAEASLLKLPIFVDDNPVVSMRYIKAHSKIMKKRGQCGLILVDYLQLADTALDKRNRNREQEIAQASRSAKIIAKELELPFILLSQLSREVERRADKTPVLSDLRESGAIEQDADIVAFIHRPAYYGVKDVEIRNKTVSTDGLGTLNIAKQRDGAIGTVAFWHNPSMTQITGYSTDEPKDEVPY